MGKNFLPISFLVIPCSPWLRFIGRQEFSINPSKKKDFILNRARPAAGSTIALAFHRRGLLLFANFP
jgi:hypothetical protein